MIPRKGPIEYFKADPSIQDADEKVGNTVESAIKKKLSSLGSILDFGWYWDDIKLPWVISYGVVQGDSIKFVKLKMLVVEDWCPWACGCDVGNPDNFLGIEVSDVSMEFLDRKRFCEETDGDIAPHLCS